MHQTVGGLGGEDYCAVTKSAHSFGRILNPKSKLKLSFAKVPGRGKCQSRPVSRFPGSRGPKFSEFRPVGLRARVFWIPEHEGLGFRV